MLKAIVGKKEEMAQYDSYILRIWRSIGEQGQQWAGRLEHVQQAESLQFTSIDALLAHLLAVAGPLGGAAADGSAALLSQGLSSNEPREPRRIDQ